MKRRLILILSLGLSLTGCLGKKAISEEKEAPLSPKIEESVESVESVKNIKGEDDSKKDEIEAKKSQPYQNIYDDIRDKKFYLDPGTSMVEAIYFYEDGYFDGMNKSGNGEQRVISLYNGKFDIVEKIDDSTYKLKLVRLDYDVEPGKSESISYDGLVCDVYYGKSLIFGDMVNDYLYLYLPNKNTADISNYILESMKQSGYIPNGNTLDKFVIGREGVTTLMEFKKEVDLP